MPRVDTLDQLLHACGSMLESEPLLGIGVDRTLIQELLRLTPTERVERLVPEAAFLRMLPTRAPR